MKELNTLVENYFTPAFGATDILRLVEQIMNETPMIVSEAQEDIDVGKEMTIDDLLGSLSINPKAWGNPEQTDGDRAVIQNYASSLGLGDNANNPDVLFRTLAESFDQLQATPEDEENKCSLMKSLSVIQILNTMSRVMSDIGNASASGFVMEAFLAALFPNGKWESDAAGAGLADFIIQGGDTDHLISLKTISEKGMIKGSKHNLLHDLFGDGTRSGGVVTYYILAKPVADKKTGEKKQVLTAKKFDITEENVSEFTGIAEEKITLWKDRQARSGNLKIDIPKNLKRKEEMLEDFLQNMPEGFTPPKETGFGEKTLRPSGQAWVLKQLKTLGIRDYDEEQAQVLAQKYDEYFAVADSIKQSTAEYADVSKRMVGAEWNEEKSDGATEFKIKHNAPFIETVATLNIDPKELLETANKSLKSIVEQLVKIQKDYRDTVREMHSYLSTLSNATAEGFKKEVSEFDQSVRKIEDSTECEPDFLK